MTRMAAIGDVAEVNPRVPAALRKDANRVVSFVPMAELSEQGYLRDPLERRLDDVIKGHTYFERGDILLAKITPCLENGKATLTGDLPHDIGFGSTEFHVLRAGPSVDRRYLFYMVWSPQFRFAAGRNMTGTAGQKRVPADFVRRFRIPLPDLHEQQRIASVVETARAVRRNCILLAASVACLKSSVFCNTFGRTAPDEELPTMRMSEVVSETQYGTPAKANDQGRGLPILRMGNITRAGGLDLSELKWCDVDDEDLQKYTVRRGDLLFNRTNSPELVGKTTVWDRDERFAFAGYLVRVRLDESLALPEYVAGFLNSPRGKQLLFARAKPSINMSNLSAGEFLRLRIPLPSLELQGRYRSVVHQLARCRELIHRAEAEAGALLTSLLQDLMS